MWKRNAGENCQLAPLTCSCLPDRNALTCEAGGAMAGGKPGRAPSPFQGLFSFLEGLYVQFMELFRHECLDRVCPLLFLEFGKEI